MSEIPAFQLQRNALGRLVYTGADGVTHEGITPVRAFPLSAPDEGVSLVATTGQELAWLPRLSQVPQPQRALLEEELAGREFMPVIQRLRSVSTFSLRTAFESTSRRTCEPPCRSSPSTMWRCAHLGQLCTVFSGKKFGIAQAQITNAVNRTAAAFHREK